MVRRQLASKAWKELPQQMEEAAGLLEARVRTVLTIQKLTAMRAAYVLLREEGGDGDGRPSLVRTECVWYGVSGTV